MVLIVGLGNPGAEYERTRHNVGWITLTQFVGESGFPSLSHSHTYNAMVSEGVLDGHEVTVFLPLTFMNRSGAAVSKYVQEKGVAAPLVVVHDDVDLPFGCVRVSHGRGAGGHNGVQSIISSIGNKDFSRIRVGIGKKNIFGIMRRPRGNALAKFVLDQFTKSEGKELETVGKKVAEAVELIVTKGVEEAMQECNKG